MRLGRAQLRSWDAGFLRIRRAARTGASRVPGGRSARGDAGATLPLPPKEERGFHSQNTRGSQKHCVQTCLCARPFGTFDWSGLKDWSAMPPARDFTTHLLTWKLSRKTLLMRLSSQFFSIAMLKQISDWVNLGSGP